MTRDELLDLIPAYALDALDPDEKKQVEALLAHDRDAQTLLSDYEAVASVLALGVPTRPAPAHLRANLKAQLAQRPKQLDQPQATAPINNTKSSRPITFPSLMWGAAAALIIVAIGLIALLLIDNNARTNSPAETLYNQLLQQDDSNRFAVIAEAADQATGDLLISANNTEAVLRVTSLPDTTSDESYQLWIISNDNTVQSGGVFDWATGHGPYYIVINPETISSLAAVGMTIEPFGGSPLENAPTGERLFAVSVAAAN